MKFIHSELPHRKLKATAYARVSSDHEDQLNSYANQKQYWEEFINNHPDLEFVGIYADEGITGTSTLKRTDFNRMIADGKRKKFDLILTKEVSRFARNTVDTLQYTRLLKTYNIGVYFDIDNIYTLDSDGELRLAIMATLAQEESRKISERVKAGHKIAMKNGVVFGSNKILGYDLINKKLKVNEDEAKIVKKIYNWYINGESLHGVVRLLAEEGITKNKAGGTFNHSTIRRILKNEKYVGDLIQKKYTTPDYLTHKQIKSKEEDYIVIRDNHEPIIERDIWNKVQTMIDKRASKYRTEGAGYNRHVWGGKMICSHCGDKYRRKVLKNADGSDRPIWQCTTYYNKGKKACSNGGYIREDILELIFMDVFKNIVNSSAKKDFIELNYNIAKEMLEKNYENKELVNIKNELNKTKNMLDKLLDLYLNNKINQERYDEKQHELFEKEISLNKQLKIYEDMELILKDKKDKIEKFYGMILRFSEADEFDKNIVAEFLEKIDIDLVNKKINIYLIVGNYETDLSKYPKRVSNREYVPIMDTTVVFFKSTGITKWKDHLVIRIVANF